MYLYMQKAGIKKAKVSLRDQWTTPDPGVEIETQFYPWDFSAILNVIVSQLSPGSTPGGLALEFLGKILCMKGEGEGVALEFLRKILCMKGIGVQV